MKKVAIIWICLFLLLSTLDGRDYRFGVVCQGDSGSVRERFLPLLKYLSRSSKQSFELQDFRSADELIAAFMHDKVDLAWIDPVTYIHLKERDAKDLSVIAQVDEKDLLSRSQSIIVLRKESTITKLSQLKGKRFAFGSRGDLLTFYFPYDLLEREGVARRLERADFLGRSDTVAKNVIMGAYDAGVVDRHVFHLYRRFLKILVHSDTAGKTVVVARRSIEAEFKQKIRTALFQMNNPKVLRTLGEEVKGFVPLDTVVYDNLDRIIKRVDQALGRRLRDSFNTVAHR